ncbi:MAG TPA: cytochrome o ubiquinol oxidase subunit I [Candidatus Paceibacterota bacterium]|nr:cytochrome o ubiquinol oxidase subunit I [Candidatus Paceibacterota bacterium]
MFGRLTIAAIEQGPIVLGAQLFILFGGLALVGLITYLKRWKWLWTEWLTSLDAKKIGVMYIVVGLVMFVRGGIDAVMMRLQQALAVGASTGYLTPEHFQQVFTGHGVIMIFFVAMPLMFGLINLVLPLQLGTRDVAFPFLNSLSFWLFVAGASLMMLSLVVGQFAATGWLAYPPLSELQYSPGVGVDYYIWALQLSGAGSLMSGINFIATILKKRCAGMTLMRMPIFAWTVLGSMLLVLFAFPVLTATLGMLSLDRYAGMHFFTSSFGANMMMYVNLIWTWGHPEVYILVLPAFGVFSEVVSVFSQKRLFGYTSMVIATMAITILSFIVWLHHFFTMGASPDVNAFFGIMTMIIAIPTGVKVFNWLFTMYRGRVIFSTPLLWFLGFVALFTIGGMAGVLMAVPPADFEFHNSLFLVAHFHTMIASGVLFGYFAAFAYWFPKVFGFRLDEHWGRRAFWAWIVGFLLAFVPLYVLGYMGATRRLDHYPAGLGWHPLFIVAAVGVAVIVVGVVCQAIQIAVSIRERHATRDATGDPWNGRTLEWSIPSPAPFYNFARTPHAESRDAFWEAKRRGADVAEGEPYKDIVLPKNTGEGIYLAAAALVFGFAMVWHIWWLVALAILAFLAVFIARSFEEGHEYVVPAAEVARLDAAARATTV